MPVGRRRKTGPRYPSGDRIPGPSPTQLKRADAVVMEIAKDAALGTRLGWMLRRKEINETQAAAGLAFARLFTNYASAMTLPRRSAASLSLEIIPRGRDSREDTKRTHRLCRKYSEASRDLRRFGDLPVIVAVCVDDQAPAWYDRERLLRGLTILASHFHLDQTPLRARKSKPLDKSNHDHVFGK